MSFIWLVDPALHCIEIYQPSDSGLPMLVRSARENDAEAPPPFDHPIPLASWWTPAAEPASP